MMTGGTPAIRMVKKKIAATFRNGDCVILCIRRTVRVTQVRQLIASGTVNERVYPVCTARKIGCNHHIA
jgi:hypothetical protein